MRLLIIALLLTTLLSGRASAQEYRYELGASVGTTYYLGTLGMRGLNAPQRLSLALDLQRPLSLHWSWWGEMRLVQLSGNSSGWLGERMPDLPERFSRSLFALTAGGEYSFFAYSDKERYLGTRSWSPYVRGSLGVVTGFPGEARSWLIAPEVSVGVGAKVRLTPRLALSAGWEMHRIFSSRVEDVPRLESPLGLGESTTLKQHDSYGVWRIGFSWGLSPRSRYGCD